MRHVVVSERLMLVLGSLLPAGAGGDRPSLTQFVREELVDIVTYFQEHWDDGLLLPNRGYPELRTLIAAGRLVSSYSVLGRELKDGSIDLMHITIDFEGLPDYEDN
jgi:hypothetical protein